MIECEPIQDVASMRIAGLAPNGEVTIERMHLGGGPEPIRFGSFTNSLSGFSVDDTESPIGMPVTYRTHLQPLVRSIQRNYVLTPRFNHGVQSWVPGTSRSIVIDPGGGGWATFSANPAGTGAGLPGRTIGDVGAAPLVAATQYLVTGRVRMHTPALWTWADVQAYGTWQDIKDDFATWQAVRQSESGIVPSDVYTTLWGGLVTGTTVHVGPFKLIDVPMARNNEWFTFAAYVTTPSPIPSTARLRIYHGTVAREYSITWDMTELQIKAPGLGDMDLGRLFYMDGDTPLPVRPSDAWQADGSWEDESGDSSIVWTGTPGNSASLFTISSKLYSDSTCQLDPPESVPYDVNGMPCDPIILSDPVNARLGAWVGLMELPGNTFPGRLGLSAAFDRSRLLPSTQVRGAEQGSMTVLTDTLEQREMLWQVIRSGRILLWRNPNPAYPEHNWYVACGDVQEQRIDGDARRPERMWTIPYTRVDRPKGLIEAATANTWADIAANFTWEELRAQRTWLQTLIDPVDA